MPNLTIKVIVQDEEKPKGKVSEWTFYVNTAYPLEDNERQLRKTFSEDFTSQLLKELKELSNG